MVAWHSNLVIQPHLGVGPVRFGMSPDDVHRMYGEPNWKRAPNDYSDSTREQFELRRLFVDFRSDTGCCAVEMYPDARVMLEEVDLMAMSYRQLVGLLRGKGLSVVELGDGFRCDDLGLACYASKLADSGVPEAPIESLMVYPRGYYDQSDVRSAKKYGRYRLMPHIGAGPLRFGMSATEVRAKLGEPTREHEAHGMDGHLREEYGACRAVVEYDASGRCCAIGLRPGAWLMCQHTDLGRLSYRSLVAFLRTQGVMVAETPAGFTCDDLGLACYASGVEGNERGNARVDALLVYERGYVPAHRAPAEG
jgi:hypothetical protein